MIITTSIPHCFLNEISVLNNTIWFVLSTSTSESFALCPSFDSCELGFFKPGNSCLTLLIPKN